MALTKIDLLKAALDGIEAKINQQVNRRNALLNKVGTLTERINQCANKILQLEKLQEQYYTELVKEEHESSN